MAACLDSLFAKLSFSSSVTARRDAKVRRSITSQLARKSQLAVETTEMPTAPLIQSGRSSHSTSLALLGYYFDKNRLLTLWQRYAARTLRTVILLSMVVTFVSACLRVSTASHRMLRRAAADGHNVLMVVLGQVNEDAS